MTTAVAMEHETLRDRICRDSAGLDRVCHELRRPVAVITAYTELLEDELSGPLNAEQKAHLAIVRRSAGRLTRSIDDLFLVFHSMLEQTPPRLERQDLERLCYDLAEQLEEAFVERGVKLSLLTKGPLWHPAVDVQRLRLALTRLLENTLAYAPEGGDVALKLQTNGRWISFEVRDPGPCLTKEDLERAFDFLYRPERNRIGECDRGGADLSVCRVLIESLGGRVRAENRFGEPTTYTLELPAKGG
jgi:two-component system phosphate regulon sensor histidine kinase PhoR